MQRYTSFRSFFGAGFFLLSFLTIWTVSSNMPASTFNPALRRYPYLTDAVSQYVTINWATDRSRSNGAVSYGKVGSEPCTAHSVAATKTAISVNGVSEYQWKAPLTLQTGTQYCYRVYLGTSPTVDLLGSDPAPSFRTQLSSKATQSYSFVVLGDWGQVDSSGTNPSQAKLMSLIASSGARFVVTTGDNGYPSGSQTNFGDLVQKGTNISTVFGPAFWRVPGASLPLFIAQGNHGLSSTDANHPALITWPASRAASTSGGRYQRDTYCCLNGTKSASYPSVWYAFNAGPARFYVLHAAWSEANIGKAPNAYKVDYDYHWAPNTAQYNWLKADLAAHPSGLKFAFMHYPIHSDNPTESSDTFLQGTNSAEGLFKQNGVNIVFTGHAHIYQRNRAGTAGVINYVTGGGGATLGALGTCSSVDAYALGFTSKGKACGSAPVPTKTDQVFHFLKVTVNGTNVTVTPINALGQSFDVMNYSFTTSAAITAPEGIVPVALHRSLAADTPTAEASPTATLTQTPIPTDSPTATPTSTPGSVLTFTAVADAKVSKASPETNFGTAPKLVVDGGSKVAQNSFIRFTVSGITGTVQSVKLRVFSLGNRTTNGPAVYLAGNDWIESGTDGITWNNQPALLSGAFDNKGAMETNTWQEYDVTGLVSGDGTYTLALGADSKDAVNFSSREGTNPPQLVVTLNTVEAPSATPSQTPIDTPTTTATPSPTSQIPSDTPTVTVTPSPTGAMSQTPVPAVTVGPGTTLTFISEADAQVAQASPDVNFGTSTTLQSNGGSGNAKISFIRFKVTGTHDTIQDVKLRVFCTDGVPNAPAVYLADNNWIESGAGGVTWNHEPDLWSSAMDNRGAIQTGAWVEYDVSSLVTGDGMYTFALIADAPDDVTFSSREGSMPPQLVITFSP